MMCRLTGHQKLLEKEGFRIIRKGKKAIIENFRNYLAFEEDKL
jgi:hypothetical protein